MLKDRLHKFRGELEDEARRIGTRFKEEFLDEENKEIKDNKKIPHN